jgi:hypothetical protein
MPSAKWSEIESDLKAQIALAAMAHAVSCAVWTAGAINLGVSRNAGTQIEQMEKHLLGLCKCGAFDGRKSQARKPGERQAAYG